MKLQYAEIKEEFEKFGWEFKQVAMNEENGILHLKNTWNIS